MGDDWLVDLAVSDGRGLASRSHDRGAEPLVLLSGLVSDLFPPPCPAIRPVWVRLDLIPPTGAEPAVADLVLGALGRQVLMPLGLDAMLPVMLLRSPAQLRFWVDRTTLPAPRVSPSLDVSMREAYACMMRRLDPGGGDVRSRIYLLLALLILQRHFREPAVELACLGLTRSLLADLQPVSTQPDAPRVVLAAGRPQLLASALLLVALAEQQPVLANGLATAEREGLIAWLLERFPQLSEGQSAVVDFAMSSLARYGLAPPGWEHHLVARVGRLMHQVGGAVTARCWCLAALLQVREPSGVSFISTCLTDLPLREILSLADLPHASVDLDISSALRVVLASRLTTVNGGDLQAGPSLDLLGKAAHLLCSRQCDPLRAMDAPEPQAVLGAFLSPASRALSPWAQLAPLFAMTQLHLQCTDVDLMLMKRGDSRAVV